MRNLILILFVLINSYLFSQDTTVTWISNIDTSAFKIYYDKKYIPIEFYSIIRISNLKEIYNSGKRFKTGNPFVQDKLIRRFNWLAVDKSKHWVLSVTYKSRGYGTSYFYIDKEKKEYIIVNCFGFLGLPNYNELKFHETLERLKSRQFYRK